MIRLFVLLLVFAAYVSAATRIEEMVRTEFVVKDSATACKAAEDFCYASAPAWMKEGKALVGRLLSFTRAPRSLAGTKIIGGEVVWIVLVENGAESDFVATPWSIVCVRASDGSVTKLVADEEKANKSLEPTRTAVPR